MTDAQDKGEHREALEAAGRLIEGYANRRKRADFEDDALAVARALLALSSRNTEMEGALRRRSIIQHVRMAHGGRTVPSGQSCALCEAEWGDVDDAGTETHEPTCLLARRALEEPHGI